jgi:hypothetical protein
MKSIESPPRQCPKHPNSCFYWNITKNRPQTGKWKCKGCNVEAVSESRRQQKKKLAGMLGGKCQCCGYNRCIGALDFHHVDPTTKEFNISQNGLTRSIHKVIEELRKCALVCANCHREIENGLRENPSLISPATEEIPPKLSPEVKKKHNQCPTCKNKKSPTSKTCWKCFNLIPRKTKILWPTKDQLSDLASSLTRVQIGNLLGVSDNAVKKRCIQLGVSFRKRAARISKPDSWVNGPVF